MIILYILKSSLCLLLILLFYKFVLENEKAHHFKRFFLLAGLLLSLIIPLLNFSFAIDPLADVKVLQFDGGTRQDYLQGENVTLSLDISPSAGISLLIYLAGVLFFSLRFIISLKRVMHQIIVGKKIRYKDHILVLTQDNQMHHSFLNFIFINGEIFEKEMVSWEVIEHELIHVRQRHTLDLFLVEALQILLWFNPLIIFYRSLIKRNHEFLADEGVLCQHQNPDQYAELLLNQASGFSNFPIRSYFKDDIVKNRILMMTRSFSLKRLFIKLTGLLPLLVVIFLLFSNSSIAENTPADFGILQDLQGTNPDVHGRQERRDVVYIDVIINSNRSIFVQDLPIQRKELRSTIGKILSFSNLDNQKIVVRIYADSSLPVNFITDVENEIFGTNLNVRTGKRFNLEEFDIKLNGGSHWFQQKTLGSKALNKADAF